MINHTAIDLKATDSYKYIKSPLYPSKYPSKVSCKWDIKASSSSKKIKLEILNVGINNHRCPLIYDFHSDIDVLEVYEGHFITLLKIACGQSNSSTTVISSDDDLLIRFRSNYDNYFIGDSAGFLARYKEVEMVVESAGTRTSK